MKNQTTRRPESPRNTRTNANAQAKTSSSARRYTKQTARVEARRDGKPLIFGWGGQLSRTEKVRIQRRATWAMAIIFALLIVVVIAGFWININVIIPAQPITSVNGHQIPQSLYRKLVALKAQIEDNKINGANSLTAQRDALKSQLAALPKQITTTQQLIDSYTKQIKALPAGPSLQRTTLTNQLDMAKKQLATQQQQQTSLSSQITNLDTNSIPLEQQLYTQTQVGTESAQWLQDDELIREWVPSQSSTIQAQINPTDTQISRALNSFKANLPKTLSYGQFLSQDSVSDGDMQAVMAIKVRRDNMQAYLASLVTSPTYQVLARSITLSTMADAQKILDQLKKGGDFGKLAKAKSADSASAARGGSLGWKVRGQDAHEEGSAVLDNWLFDRSRKIDELSSILTVNGAFRIVQILGIDPFRTIDKDTLKTLKDNALDSWLILERALPGMSIGMIDQNKLFDAMNMPPGLPISPPSAPGGVPTPTTP